MLVLLPAAAAILTRYMTPIAKHEILWYSTCGVLGYVEGIILQNTMDIHTVVAPLRRYLNQTPTFQAGIQPQVFFEEVDNLWGRCGTRVNTSVCLIPLADWFFHEAGKPAIVMDS
ncbi:hypothetical protein FRC09_005934 [Ceratobasidium sp. 395]|nr:hypothetical protein FRC09_005934 [Ceratobasidium sp. 395]